MIHDKDFDSMQMGDNPPGEREREREDKDAASLQTVELFSRSLGNAFQTSWSLEEKYSSVSLNWTFFNKSCS